MIMDFSPPQKTRRSTGLAVTLVVHALLIVGWQYARKAPHADADDPADRIQWVTIAPLAPAKPPESKPLPTPARASPPAVAAAKPPPIALVPAAPQAVAEAPPAAAPPPLSAYEIMQQAKRSVGKIDQDLRKTYPGQPITAPVSNGATRLAKGMQDAADAAPNKWYQAPKVTEIIDPGPYGRRRYRVVGPLGTYCITVESNHAPDGIDQMKKGIQQKVTTCDDDEQAPTWQKFK